MRVASDAHDVSGVLSNDVAVLVHECLSHALCVVDVHAEDNGLGESVGLLEELRQLPSHLLGALSYDHLTVEVLLLVDAVLYPLPLIVDGAGLGPPAVDVHVHLRADDLVGREEAVLDALLERVGVNRLAEVVDVAHVLGLFGRSCHAQLNRAREVVEHLPPRGVGSGAAPVALVYDDEVEELGVELSEYFLAVFGHELLVEREVDFVGGVEPASLHLCGHPFERLEVTRDCLINQDVAVG